MRHYVFEVALVWVRDFYSRINGEGAEKSYELGDKIKYFATI